MSYSVKNSAGNVIAVVADRTIDTDTTPLSLVGYNATSYGLAHSENFVHLLENFAADFAPENPMQGQFWFDTTGGTMKVYSNGKWSGISGTPSTGGGAGDNGLSAVYHCPINGLNTSVLLMFAGGQIVAVIASIDVAPNFLPASVIINAIEYVFASRFVYGLEAGVTLADADGIDGPNDFVFSGRVPTAEQSHFAGGGNDKPAGWAYADLGSKSVAVMIASGQIVGAVSSVAVGVEELPVNITVYVRADDRSIKSTVIPFRARFPGGLFNGLTYGTGSNGQLDVTVAAAIATEVSNRGTAIARATDEIHLWVDSTSATAQRLLAVETTFKSVTGAESTAAAIQELYAKATEGGADAALRTEVTAAFKAATGSESLAGAGTVLRATVDGLGATSSKIDTLESTFRDVTGQTSTAAAISKLWTVANATGPAAAGWSLSLDSNGYAIGIEALNGGASNNYVKIKTDRFIIGSDNLDFIPFEIRNGVVYMKNAAIENLTIGGEKITPGAVSLTFAASWSGDINAFDWHGTALTPYAQTPSFVATGIPALARAFVTVCASGRQSGSTSDPFYVGVQKTYWDGNAFQIAYLPTQPIFNFNAKEGVSQSWTFVDDNIDANMSLQPITYQVSKVQGSNAGRLTQLNIIAIVGKK